MTNSWIKIGLTGLVLASTLATGTFAQGRGARSLDLTRAQKEQALAIARAMHDLVGTLTPEQRARLEQRARRHGRTFDPARFERRLALRLSRPGAAARIQKSLDR